MLIVFPHDPLFKIVQKKLVSFKKAEYEHFLSMAACHSTLFSSPCLSSHLSRSLFGVCFHLCSFVCALHLPHMWFCSPSLCSTSSSLIPRSHMVSLSGSVCVWCYVEFTGAPCSHTDGGGLRVSLPVSACVFYAGFSRAAAGYATL